MNIFNIGNNIRMSTLVNINLSASQWDLHVESYPRHTIEKAANYLNNRFNQGYNKGLSKEQLKSSMEEIMSRFDIYGAAEKETRKVLENLLEKVYP